MVISTVSRAHRRDASAACDSGGLNAARIAAGLVRQAATLSTCDGRFVTGAVAEFEGSPRDWSARLGELDRPGNVASLFFAEGVRDVIVRLEDGRRARGRLIGTTFLASAQRVCTVAGSEPFM